MRTLYSAFLLVYFILPVFALSQSGYDVQHYRFDIELSDKSDTIRGKARIDIKLLKASEQLTLDFTTTSGGKGMKVNSCTVNGTDAVFTEKDNHEKLQVGWKKILPAGSLISVQINYEGIPSDGLIISKNMYGHRSFFADNWPDRGHKWIPCHDNPGDKATVEFIVTAPAHYKVVSNGLMLSETPAATSLKQTHWKEDVPVATKVMVIGVADFAVDLAATVQDSIPVYSWVYPENRDKGFYDYGQAKDVLPFFIKYVGPYGYKKLANVQSKTIFGGLENANTIFYAENTVTGTRKTESLLAHEIAHQWFGNMATEKTFAHLWLSEGFATYMTILYMENKYGRDTAVYMLKEDREQVVRSSVTTKRPVVDETTDYMALLNTNSYQKGGWILHMLRHELGDTLFNKSVKAYYKQYANGNADTRDLQKVIEQTSGKDLSVFFDQWLYKPGIPVLDIKWGYGFKTDKTWIEITQLQDNGFEFSLPVKLTDKKGQISMRTVKVSNRYTKVEVDGRIEKMEPDPETILLFKAAVQRIAAK